MRAGGATLVVGADGRRAESRSRLGREEWSGIVRASAERDVTYADVARRPARRVGADPGLVDPEEAVDRALL
jgi:hypothetical protein